MGQASHSVHSDLKGCVKAVILLNTLQRESGNMPWKTLLEDQARMSMSVMPGLPANWPQYLAYWVERNADFLRGVPQEFHRRLTNIKVYSCLSREQSPVDKSGVSSALLTWP